MLSGSPDTEAPTRGSDPLSRFLSWDPDLLNDHQNHCGRWNRDERAEQTEQRATSQGTNHHQSPGTDTARFMILGDKT